MARVAAKEKLSTEVTDIAMEAKQRFTDLKSDDSWAIVRGLSRRVLIYVKGMTKAMNRSIGKRILKCI